MAETIGARERGRITPDEGAVLAAETARNADFGKPVLIYPIPSWVKSWRDLLGVSGR